MHRNCHKVQAKHQRRQWDGWLSLRVSLGATYPTSSIIHPDHLLSHLHSPGKRSDIIGYMVWLVTWPESVPVKTNCNPRHHVQHKWQPWLTYRSWSFSCLKRCQCFVPETVPVWLPFHLLSHTKRKHTALKFINQTWLFSTDTSKWTEKLFCTWKVLGQLLQLST